MNTGIRLGRKTSLLITLLGLVAAVAWMLACAASHRAVEAPVPTDNYTFTRYEIPEIKPPASVPVTVAVVNPSYANVAGKLGLSKFVKSFSDFLGSSLDEIIVAKGMTAKGPYDSLDMITYPDKKGSDLTLTGKLFISPGTSEPINTERVSVNSSGRNIQCDLLTFEATAEVWITLEMREPLSGEKMWVKKIDLGTHTAEYQAAFALTYTNRGRTVMRKRKALFDTREDTIAKLFDTLYPMIMETAWNYLNTDEMLMLKKTGEEIRKVKRY